MRSDDRSRRSPFPHIAAALAASALSVPAALAQQAQPAPGGEIQVQGAQELREELPSFSNLAQQLLPAVVNVSTTTRASSRRGVGPEQPRLPPGTPFEDMFPDLFDRYFGRPEPETPMPRDALGSGFIIDPTGYVVTNHHVVAEAEEVRIILADDREFSAEIVGTDPRTDLALLKVESEEALPSVPWGDSDQAEVGDWVMAIGNPFGLGGTVTAGIVSARARNINAGPYDDFIQTDASINRGNSGGPLFNLRGEVVGVNTAIFSPTGASVGIGFAIPSAIAEPIVAELRQTGEVERGWLGVSIQPLNDEIVSALGLEQEQGALVAEVVPDSPAAKAGIEVGDVIVGFGGQPVADPRDLSRSVAAAPVGETREVTILRDGQRQTAQVEIERLEDEPRLAAMEVPEGGTNGEATLGLALAPLTDELRAQLGIEGADEGGAVVVDVQPGSVAAQRGFEPGDVIRRIGRTDVEAPSDAAEAIRRAREADQDNILVLREREGQQLFTTLPLTEAG